MIRTSKWETQMLVEGDYVEVEDATWPTSSVHRKFRGEVCNIIGGQCLVTRTDTPYSRACPIDWPAMLKDCRVIRRDAKLTTYIDYSIGAGGGGGTYNKQTVKEDLPVATADKPKGYEPDQFDPSGHDDFMKQFR